MKKALLQFCWNHVEVRSNRLKVSLDDLQESLDSETKSTAGDKHETGRAMVQLEQEKLAQQVQELEQTRDILKKIDIERKSKSIGLGSWVKTSLADYFIAISAGTFKHEGGMVYCISTKAPIAQLLMGKSAGDSFMFNGKTYVVLSVE